MGRDYSKAGCHMCKRRRKKCDEQRPRCGACSRLGMTCSYRDAETTTPANSAVVAGAARPGGGSMFLGAGQAAEQTALQHTLSDVVTTNDPVVGESHDSTGLVTSNTTCSALVQRDGSNIPAQDSDTISGELTALHLSPSPEQKFLNEHPAPPPSHLTPYLPASRSATPQGWNHTDGLGNYIEWSLQSSEAAVPHAVFEDITVRAVLDGWTAAEARGCIHPIWKALRKIDQENFIDCQPIDRFAMLRHTSLILGVHFAPLVNWNKNMPDVFSEWTVRRYLRSFGAAYIYWPGLRAALFKNKNMYDRSMWKSLCHSIRFRWPHELRDAYHLNTRTEMYEITSDFDDSLRDINNWSLCTEFLVKFPELINGSSVPDKEPDHTQPIICYPAWRNVHGGRQPPARNDGTENDDTNVQAE